jgi:hypothetical protein
MRTLRLVFLLAVLAVSMGAYKVTAATCGATCFTKVRDCRYQCSNQGGTYCYPVNDCTDPCAYVCACENVKLGDPC